MARYFSSRPQEFISQFAPENLGIQQNYYDNLQRRQDNLQANIGALQQDIPAREYDKPDAFNLAKKVNSQLDGLRSLNANDPNQQKQIFEGIKQARNIMSPYGEGNAYKSRLVQDQSINKAIDEDKDLTGENAWMKTWSKNRFEQLNNPESNPVNYNPNTGQFNQIKAPEKLKPVDAKKEVHAVLDDISKDKSYQALGYGNTPVEFTKSYREGDVSGYGYQKVAQALLNRIGEPDNIRTYQAKSETLLGPGATDERNFATFDKDGKFVKFNTDTLLGRELEGSLIGKTSREEDFKTNFIKDDLGLYQAKKKDDLKDLNITTSSQSEALPGSLTKLPSEIENLKFNDDGSLKAITTGSSRPYTNEEATNIYKQYGTTANGVGKQAELAAAKINAGLPIENKFDMDANVKAIQLVTDLQKNNPELRGLSPKNTIEAYKTAHKSLESESLPLESISNVAAKDLGEAIARNGIQRNVYLYDGKGKTIDGQLSTVLKETGLKEADLLKQIKENGIAGYTQAGPSAGSYYAEITDDDGNNRRIMISPDNEMAKIFRTSQTLNEARKQLKQVEVKPIEDNPNYSILVNPTISKDGKTNWQYVELLKDNNGKVIKSNPTTLEDLRESERKKLESSNYLGSQTGILKPHTTE